MEKHKLIQKKFGICICSILTVLAFYIYQPSAYSKTEKHTLKLQPKESFEVRNGRIIYNEHCAPCHGVTGKGNGNYYASGLKPKPRDFTSPKFMKQVRDDYLFDVITKGTAAFGMSPFCPPWGATLGEEEKIKNIISFLRTLYKRIDIDDTAAKKLED